MNTELLKELGFEKAAGRVDKQLDLKRRLAVAYERFKVVPPEALDKFQSALRERTYIKKITDKYGSFDEEYEILTLIPLKDYPEVPPMDCLLDLKKAKEMDVFTSFEVVRVEKYKTHQDLTPKPDPIIFGVIDGCVDRFFITQWDDDVSFEQIMGE